MKFIQFVKSKIYPHQHPETALRYIPIVKLLEKRRLVDKKILEIGSGSYGITPYLKKKVVGIDFDFSEPESKLLTQVKGLGEKLPFKQNEFDIVILSDVLEHVPPKNRTSVLRESIRVASLAVIVSGPFGDVAFEHDKKLAKILNHPFLKEHLLYGLPQIDLVMNDKNPKIKKTKLVGEYLNLSVRKYIMWVFAQKNRFAYYIYLKGLMPFIPLLIKLNKKPCYRSLFLIELN